MAHFHVSVLVYIYISTTTVVKSDVSRYTFDLQIFFCQLRAGQLRRYKLKHGEIPKTTAISNTTKILEKGLELSFLVQSAGAGAGAKEGTYK